MTRELQRSRLRRLQALSRGFAYMKLTEVLAGIGAEQQSGLSGGARGHGRGPRLAQGEAGRPLRRRSRGHAPTGRSFVGGRQAEGRGRGRGARRPVQADGPVFQVSNARQALALIAANFYRKPARRADAARRHRHQREDHHHLAAGGDLRRGRRGHRPHRHHRAPASRAARSSPPTPRPTRSRCTRSSARWSTPAPTRW